MVPPMRWQNNDLYGQGGQLKSKQEKKTQTTRKRWGEAKNEGKKSKEFNKLSLTLIDIYGHAIRSRSCRPLEGAHAFRGKQLREVGGVYGRYKPWEKYPPPPLTNYNSTLHVSIRPTRKNGSLGANAKEVEPTPSKEKGSIDQQIHNSQEIPLTCLHYSAFEDVCKMNSFLVIYDYVESSF